MKHPKVFYSHDNRDLFMQHLRIRGCGRLSKDRAYRLFALYELIKKDPQGVMWPADSEAIYSLTQYRKLKLRTIYRDLDLLGKVGVIHVGKAKKYFDPFRFMKPDKEFMDRLMDLLNKGQ